MGSEVKESISYTVRRKDADTHAHLKWAGRVDLEVPAVSCRKIIVTRNLEQLPGIS